MKIVYISFFLVFFLSLPSKMYAQLDWDKVSYGFSLRYSITDGDLKEFWGNFFSPGFLLQYKLPKDFQILADISGSYLKPLEDNQNKLPHIFLINAQLLLKYTLINKNDFMLTISPGLTNSTFIFSGTAANLVGDNFIEHEFGINVSSGIEFLIEDAFWLEIFISGQNIFSYPEYLVLYSLGLKFLLK